MNTLSLSDRIFAISLAALAGYVDATGFIQLGGFFVSFMSGNSTRAAVGLVQHLPDAGIAFTLIGSFVAGVICGSLAGGFAGQRRRGVVLLVVAALLAAAAAFHGFGAVMLAGAAMAFAMGAENAIFEHQGEVRVGLTYMTGALVKFGQRIAGALRGGPPLAWAPHLFLWLGLVGGAIAGAASYPLVGAGALWFAASWAGALAVHAFTRRAGARS
jgi:uncharacterized membrane protein YoaK (UPF0700 family)